MLRKLPLHHYILQHQTEAAIKEIKETKDLDQINEQGLTALQFASMQGENTVVAKLLTSGATYNKTTALKHDNPVVVENANKTPEDLAIQQGHSFVVDTISSFEVIKKSPTLATLDGMLFWRIMMKKDSLDIFMFYPQEKIVSGMVELAAYLNHSIYVKELFEDAAKYHFKLRLHSTIRTAAYWAAFHNNQDMFANLSLTDTDKVYALWQLKLDKQNEIFKKYYQLASASVKEQLKKSLEKNSETIHPAYIFAYEAACHADSSLLQDLCSDINDLYAVLSYAYEQGSFVAVHQCIQLWKSFSSEKQNDFTKEIMRQGLNSTASEKIQKEVMNFWLAANQIHPCQIITLFLSDPETRRKAIKTLWSQEGLLKYSISRLLADDSTPQDEKFFVYLEKSDEDVFQALLHCLQIRFSDRHINKLLTTPKNIPLQSRLVLAQAEKFTPELKHILNSHFKKFNLFINCDAVYRERNLYSELPNAILMKILNEMFYGKNVDVKKIEKSLKEQMQEEVDEPEEKKSVPTELDARNLPYQMVSSHFYLLSKMTNPSDKNTLVKRHKNLEDEIKQDFLSLETSPTEIEHINALLEYIEDEINNLNTCGRRIANLKFCQMMCTVILGIIFGLNIKCVLHLESTPGKYLFSLFMSKFTSFIFGAFACAIACFSINDIFCVSSVVRKKILQQIFSDFPERLQQQVALVLPYHSLLSVLSLDEVKSEVTSLLESKQGLFSNLPQKIKQKERIQAIYTRALDKFKEREPEGKKLELPLAQDFVVDIPAQHARNGYQSLLQIEEKEGRQSSCRKLSGMCTIL